MTDDEKVQDIVNRHAEDYGARLPANPTAEDHGRALKSTLAAAVEEALGIGMLPLAILRQAYGAGERYAASARQDSEIGTVEHLSGAELDEIVGKPPYVTVYLPDALAAGTYTIRSTGANSYVAYGYPQGGTALEQKTELQYATHEATYGDSKAVQQADEFLQRMRTQEIGPQDDYRHGYFAGIKATMEHLKRQPR